MALISREFGHVLGLLVGKPILGDGLYSVWRSCLPGREEVRCSALGSLSCGMEVMVSREKLFVVCFCTVIKDYQINLSSSESHRTTYYHHNCSWTFHTWYGGCPSGLLISQVICSSYSLILLTFAYTPL